MPSNNSVASLVLRVFLWLPICFFCWYTFSDILLAPIEFAIASLVKLLFPGSINTFELINGSIVFDSNYPFRAADGRIGNVAFKINVLRYTFNLPVIAALCMAVSSWKTILGRLVLVYVLLLPVWLWGAFFYYLKTITLGLGSEASASVGITGWPLEIIGLLYQFGYLMLPTISVPLIWLFVCKRDFCMVTAAFASLISQRSESPGDRAPSNDAPSPNDSPEKPQKVKRRDEKLSRS
ncbi:MAG: exosortase H-associated membrane protein [Methylococcales bacterium]